MLTFFKCLSPVRAVFFCFCIKKPCCPSADLSLKNRSSDSSFLPQKLLFLLSILYVFPILHFLIDQALSLFEVLILQILVIIHESHNHVRAQFHELHERQKREPKPQARNTAHVADEIQCVVAAHGLRVDELQVLEVDFQLQEVAINDLAQIRGVFHVPQETGNSWVAV